MVKDFLLAIPNMYRLSQAVIGKDKDLMNLACTVKARDKILDIGCGPARLLSRLPESVEYYGLDPSQPYIDQARNTFKNRKATFYCAGIDDFTPDANIVDSCDVVIASGVLHHLDDSQAEKLLRVAYAALKKRGILLTLDTCFTPKQNPVARFLAKMDRGQFVRYADEYRNLLETVFHENITVIVHNNGARFPYNHITMRAVK